MPYSPGTHIIASLHTSQRHLLEKYENLQTEINGWVSQYNLQQLGAVYHNFDPEGYTAVICLSESHISVHTWPEFGRVNLDITLLNVVSHGIPYMALVWLYGKRQQPTSFLRMVFGRWGIIIFLGIIFLFAYVEEGLWDMTLWKEHVNIFPVFHLKEGKLPGPWLAFVVPLLALPQVTHYIIDGFIWRRQNGRSD